MKHISHSTFRGNADDGVFIMPVTLHRTYCRIDVQVNEIDNENPTCDDCMDAKTWEIIDAELGSLAEV